MEFSYRLTIWECIVCGAKRAFRQLVYKSKVLRVCILILIGTAVLSGILSVAEGADIQGWDLLLIVYLMVWAVVIILLIRVPAEILLVYRQCGKWDRTVQIRDGSIIVTAGGVVREYLCRNIVEIKKWGCIYRITMTGRLETMTELYLPVRLMGGRQEQENFKSCVNDQRRISGDKLAAGAAEIVLETAEPGGGIVQRWNLDMLTEAVAEGKWLSIHCVGRRRWRNRGRQISMRAVKESLRQYGAEVYEESWKLYFTSQGILIKIPMLQTEWAWSEVGYLLETDDFYHFFTREQRPMFYMEKALLGDWMARKLFVQDCQAKGISCKLVYPELIRDTAPDGEWTPLLKVVPPVKECSPAGNIPDTQEGWRKFWAEKEKGKGDPDRLRVAVTILAVAGIFLLAVFLPDFGRGQDFGGVPVMMDMPKNGEEYVFHPEAYENYMPLTDQVNVLESLGFIIPESVVEAMNRGLEEMPMNRVWVEGYPYTGLLTAIGMPERDTESWEITRYPEQAYWFDWEGFDMSTEYRSILNGVNAMAGGELAITDAEQEMSDADWEKGTGTIHVRFRINGEQYEYPLRLMNDWLDTEIVGDINEALKKAGVEKRVYALGDGGQGCILLYRDKEWARRFEDETGIKLETK